MKTVYFVTEGATDQIVLEALVAMWLADSEFLPRHIQPPSSAYMEDLESNLSTGWKGVLAWCEGRHPQGPAGRNEAIRQADCLIIHTDADVAADNDFKQPAFVGSCPPARNACDWVRSHLSTRFGETLPANVVICVPSKDLEAWVLCSLHPEVAEEYKPIECRPEPGALLVQRPPYRLVRSKDGALKKETARYRNHSHKIAAGWSNCAAGDPPRCPEAARFELEAKRVLGV